MNYFKNTRGKGVPQDNKGFFAIEQFSTSITMVLLAAIIFYLPISTPSTIFTNYQNAFTIPSFHWPYETIAGFAYGIAAFFSVFLFMYKGRTATFSSLVNRLTSLVAGTVGTLLFALIFHAKMPSISEWSSLLIIFIAIAFLTKADRRRVAELKKQHVI
jgi:drug/metabolite transporter (DMT)-like permease